jgi:hypothetical protein
LEVLVVVEDVIEVVFVDLVVVVLDSVDKAKEVVGFAPSVVSALEDLIGIDAEVDINVFTAVEASIVFKIVEFPPADVSVKLESEDTISP